MKPAKVVCFKLLKLWAHVKCAISRLVSGFCYLGLCLVGTDTLFLYLVVLEYVADESDNILVCTFMALIIREQRFHFDFPIS